MGRGYPRKRGYGRLNFEKRGRSNPVHVFLLSRIVDSTFTIPHNLFLFGRGVEQSGSSSGS
jgi:hypothetical protein